MNKLPPSIIKRDWDELKSFFDGATILAIIMLIITFASIAFTLFVLITYIFFDDFQKDSNYVDETKDYIKKVDAFCVKVHNVEGNLIVFKQYRTCLMDNVLGQGEWER